MSADQPYRGSRCGVCYWSLYDGDWCQNPQCAMSGKSVDENRVRLTNEEARLLIESAESRQPQTKKKRMDKTSPHPHLSEITTGELLRWLDSDCHMAKPLLQRIEIAKLSDAVGEALNQFLQAENHE
jgi:hypothetical protein